MVRTPNPLFDLNHALRHQGQDLRATGNAHRRTDDPALANRASPLHANASAGAVRRWRLLRGKAQACLTVGCLSLAAGSGRTYSVRWSVVPVAEQRSAGTSASAPSEPADRDLCLLSVPIQQAGDGIPSMLAHDSGAVDMPAFRA